MSGKCPACKTVVADHESEQAFPSVVNVKGYKGLTRPCERLHLSLWS